MGTCSIISARAHDNNGGLSEEADIHLVPGEGDIDFSKILIDLDGICYRDTFTLELTPFDSLERKFHALNETRNLFKQYLP